MTQFLTVKEAALSTGKSPSSIRRIIYPILDDEKHRDRQQIQPSVDEVQQFRMKGENFAWRISEELLRREIPPVSEFEKGTAKSGEGPFEMRLLHFRRTFVEKMFAIHGKVEAFRRGGPDIGGYARHYYDLFCLAGRPEVAAMLRSDEYAAIKVDYDRISRVHFEKSYFPPEDMRFAMSDALFSCKGYDCIDLPWLCPLQLRYELIGFSIWSREVASRCRSKHGSSHLRCRMGQS